MHQRGITDIRLESLVFDVEEKKVTIVDKRGVPFCVSNRGLSENRSSRALNDIRVVGQFARGLLGRRSITNVTDSPFVHSFHGFDSEFDGVSMLAKDFVTSLLQRDIRNVTSAVETLKHPWLAEDIKQNCVLYSGLGGRRGAYEVEPAASITTKMICHQSSDVSTCAPSVGSDEERVFQSL